MNLVKEKVAEMKGIPEEKDLVESLQKAILEITFNKLDGEERIMTCTKVTNLIPEDKRPKTDKPSKEGTITVWDMKAEGWRSFRYDRVTKAEACVFKRLLVAQLDRALVCGTKGRRFESSREGQNL